MAESEVDKVRTELSEALQFIDLLEQQQQPETAAKDNEIIFQRKQKYEGQMELPSIAEGPDDTMDFGEDSDY